MTIVQSVTMTSVNEAPAKYACVSIVGFLRRSVEVKLPYTINAAAGSQLQFYVSWKALLQRQNNIFFILHFLSDGI